MPSPLTEHHGLLLSRAAVLTADGHDLGPVVDLYFDDLTGQPAWATVRAATPARRPSGSPGRLALVPLRGATYSRGVLRVVATAEQVATVPTLPPGDHLDGRDELTLHAHYGSAAPVDPVPVPQTTAVRTAEAASDGTTGEQLTTA
jgi:hypothetical protein